VYPALARLQWERRTLPGETNEQMFAELNRVMTAMHRTAGGHRIKGGIQFVRQPHYVDADSLPARLLAQAFPDTEQTGVAYWADSALLGPHVPTILFGPKGHGAHAIDEWVSLSSLVRVFDGLKRVIDSWND
jgi:acetylornithine deacetylase